MEKEFTQEEKDALFAYWTDVENEMLVWAEENGAEDYHKGKSFLSCRYLPNILHKEPEDFKAALQLSLAWTNGWIKASQEG
jgi:hypothetical protein